MQPFQPRGKRRSHSRRPCEDSFVVNNDESIPKLADRNTSRKLALCPQVSIFPPPSNGHFTPQLEQSDYPDNEGWKWQEDIQAWADCDHGIQTSK
ncbi:hypothetical protein O181_037172 [Austropuccinia psidii MF-1]|uniref:Uncharacterized protein n=1 Tax=Austropuccinia psidii MF-1 TaxID=1389203 RepID=A0A9Q3HAM4_9BASI|nr:hypothetical protein [Austropuccinia psidii MF-1]